MAKGLAPTRWISSGVVLLALVAAWQAGSLSTPPSPPEVPGAQPPQAVDAWLETRWQTLQLEPAPAAEPLLVLRRLSLALLGTVPSLEEVRAFEADTRPDRLGRWTAARLADPRHHRYFAERLARAFVGTHRGAFIVYRRDLFVDWLEAQLAANRPFDALVRELIASNGVWTGSPATNFVTAAVVEKDVDPAALAGRTSRAFLGLRLDCAQCHDHPFAPWTQAQFKDLTAFYSGVDPSPFGLKKVPATGTPHVPFGPEWETDAKEPRARLAAWVTSPKNPRFARATVNRVWGLMFGRPFSAPVDDVPEPGDANTALLDVLAQDFVASGYDLRRLVRTIAGSRAFGLSSVVPHDAPRAAHEAAWAVFPLTPIRPEQWVGSALQAANPKTIDQNSHVAVRAVRFLREKGFVDEYGDPGEDELAPRAATVAQALLRLNGKLPEELVEPNPFTTVGRVAMLSNSPEAALEALWLSFLARRPSVGEAAAFLPLLAVKGDARGKSLSDLAWALFNSPEFSWNH